MDAWLDLANLILHSLIRMTSYIELLYNNTYLLSFELNKNVENHSREDFKHCESHKQLIVGQSH